VKKLFLLILLTIPIALFGQGSHSATLNWAASPTTNVTGYNVYRLVGACSATATFTKLTASPIAVLTYTDGTVTAGTTYCYSVTAVSPGGESPGAGTWQVTIPTFTASAIPAPPASLTGTAQ
jgi:hypothetical protein